MALTRERLNEWREEFSKDPANVMARNAVTTVGAQFATTDSNEVNKITHIFMNTCKKHHLRATDQAYSGRCWMFAGMNAFRHKLIEALGMKNFEFSETYLLFYDKLERSNYFLRWFLEHPEYALDSREVQHMLDGYRTDGGYFSMFVDLVAKYGLVPKEAMPETYQSGDTGAMNAVISERLDSCVLYIRDHRHEPEECEAMIERTIRQVHDALIKFLGEPPTSFRWNFECTGESGDYEGQGFVSNPVDFTQMVMPSGVLDIRDFVYLVHDPQYATRKVYEMRYTAGMYGGHNVRVLNLPIDRLKEYTKQSILGGLPVWFGCDVSKGFSYMHGALNTRLHNTSLVFGDVPRHMDKADRSRINDTGANHAMVLIGFNADENERVTEWQVENSWGYFDNETPGLDGFLSMTDEWFDANVFQVAVHKGFLSRIDTKLYTQEPIMLEPWQSAAPARRVGPVYKPRGLWSHAKSKK